MSYLRTIQERLEALILGDSGEAPFTIEQGRFRLLGAETASLEEGYASTSERTIEVEVDPGYPLEGTVNNCDGWFVQVHPFRVKVSYQFTNSGEGDSEGVDPQQGSGTMRDIRSRVVTDIHDICRVLSWYANHAGLTPNVFYIERGDRATVSKQGEKVTVQIPFSMKLVVNTTSSYV